MHSRARSLLLIALALACAVLAASCGPSGPDPQASFSGATLRIQARDLTFAPDIATAPAGTPLKIVLDNKDPGVPHNLRIFKGDTEIAKTASVEGPGLVAVELPPLAPGNYQFDCTIHPDMIGSIIVSAGASAGPSDPNETLPPDAPTDAPGDSVDASAGS